MIHWSHVSNAKKVLSAEVIRYVIERKKAGDGIDVIAKSTRMPEMVIAAVIRSEAERQSIVDNGGSVD